MFASSRPRLGWILALIAGSLLLWDVPLVGWILTPLKILITAIHEMGHAVACVLTGGTVAGLTIVADHEGHGGLTFGRGGNSFIYTQMGYLGTTLAGCALLALGRLPRLSRPLLVLIGSAMLVASVLFMAHTILVPGHFIEALGSLLWGLALAAALIYGGWKLDAASANLLLLFIGVQTALNALTGLFYLVQLSFGMTHVKTWSDASIMQDMTGIPALVWALAWGLISVVMVGGTLWWIYRSEGAAAKELQAV